MIPARGGSQAIPRKNLASLGGKPLIAWTIEVARSVRDLDKIIVSTDDNEIATIARHYGAEVPFLRPAEISRSDSPTIEAVIHALHWLAQHADYHPELVLLLQPTSPFRTADDIYAALHLMRASHAPAVVSVTMCHPHPFLTFRLDAQGILENLLGKDVSHIRRQDLPPVYQLNGAIYLVKTSTLLREKTFLPAGTRALIMPRNRSLDIDEPLDLMLARCLVEEGLWKESSTLQAA
ncbi:MAG: acylneuraminate cytidylyltransferase family protein [Gemmatales bacterium]|nr:acylneuraminate cytidylyltransferase family protein [Gemmatales bacterium]